MARTTPDEWTRPRTPACLGERQVWLPVVYPDCTQFATVHRASYDEVARVLPGEDLRPARWWDGSALVMVAAMRYRDVTVQADDGSPVGLLPLAEMLIGPLVGYGRSPRAVPVGRQSAFVLHMPVTTRQAHDLGRAQWGFPKFVADMEFSEGPRERRVRLSEGGQEILTMAVHPAGPVLPDRSPFDSYTCKDGDLLRTTLPMAGHVQVRFGRRGGELALGCHEVAEGLRRLGIQPAPVVSYSYLDQRFVLPAGRPVGRAPAHCGFEGADRPLGRYTVGHPSTGPVDQYAALAAPA